MLEFSINTGAHNFHFWEYEVEIPNLPPEFHGLKIGQISDIHAGSFNKRNVVNGGIDVLLSQKPDIIFFTGDLVNKETSEISDFFDILSQIKAPLGVYSVLGNHDYGDKKRWNSERKKVKNLQDMVDAHKAMGWQLLLNENKIIQQKEAKLAIIGVENWGYGKFVKYGDLDIAKKGTENADVKILLTHDPSHWEYKVLGKHQDIDITFSGHTHGFQIGIETPDFQWSPSKYYYNYWAGLYKVDHQYLYVNRGYGYLNVPVRVGILPEVTVLELKKEDSD